jgi:hypothetical protein
MMNIQSYSTNKKNDKYFTVLNKLSFGCNENKNRKRNNKKIQVLKYFQKGDYFRLIFVLLNKLIY